MSADTFERLLALRPTVVSEAQAAAKAAVASIPSDLAPGDEPAHVYDALPSGAPLAAFVRADVDYG